MIPLDILMQLNATPTPAEPPTAPWYIQGLRGLLSGATLNAIGETGLYNPFPEKDYGKPGGLETVGNLAGGIAAFTPLLRGAGIATAGLGKLAPSLLAKGAEAGQAAKNMARFAPLTANLSYKGRLLANAATGAGAALIPPALWDNEPRTATELMTSAALGIGGGLAGEALIQRGLKKAAARAATAVGAAKTIDPKGYIKTSLQEAIDKVADTIKTIDAQMETATGPDLEKLTEQRFKELFKMTGFQKDLARLAPEAGPAQGNLLSRIESFAPTSEAISTSPGQQLDLLSQSPLRPTRGVVEQSLTRPGEIQFDPYTSSAYRAAPTATAAALPEAINKMSIDQIKMFLKSNGVMAMDLPDDRLRQMAAEILSRGRPALPPYIQNLQRGEGGRFLPTSGAVTRQAPVIAEALRGEKGQVLRGPVFSTLTSPGFSFGSQFEITNAKLLKGKITNMISRGGIPTAIPKDIDIPNIQNGITVIRDGKSWLLPRGTSETARVLDDIPFPDIRGFLNGEC